MTKKSDAKATINRRTFLKMTALLGIGTSFNALLTSQAQGRISVLIIGAGAAGMSAGYLLQQQGIDYQILEASPTYGGRMKRNTDFADFPIPLGAEWIHTEDDILDEIVNDSAIDVDIQLRAYSSEDTTGYFEDGELTLAELEDGDIKFIGSTWFDFFEQYIVPDIQDNMQFNTQIVNITYNTSYVTVTDQQGNRYQADKIIVCVPLKILQDDDITFNPRLPEYKATAIADAPVWGGIKVFIEFTEKFYPDELELSDSYTQRGQRLYYDASYGQDTDMHILGLFAVGEQAEAYQALSPDDDLREYILDELDTIFDGRASETYVKHLAQNWNDEPFIRGAYIADNASWRIPPLLQESIVDTVFFAGTAFTDGEDSGSVHNATRSARDAVDEILDELS